jgi:hypothetical protein
MGALPIIFVIISLRSIYNDGEYSLSKTPPFPSLTSLKIHGLELIGNSAFN